MRRVLLAVVMVFPIACGGGESGSSADASIDGSATDASGFDTAPNACVTAGGKCGLKTIDDATPMAPMPCDQLFVPTVPSDVGWVEVATSDPLYGSCGTFPGTPEPYGHIPCCMPKPFELADCAPTCVYGQYCAVFAPPAVCPTGDDAGSCPAGCPGCAPIPPPTCRTMPDCSGPDDPCPCFLEKLCAPFGGSCEYHRTQGEWVVSCATG